MIGFLKWIYRINRISFPPLIILIFSSGCFFPVWAQQDDRRIERIVRITRQINEQIAESERIEESNGIYCNELVVNKGDKSWPAVGIYRTVIKFYYTFGDREKNPYPDRLLKITAATQRSDRHEYAEYIFNPAGLLIFHHQKDGESAESERRYYFASERPIRLMKGQRILGIKSQEGIETTNLALNKMRNLREIFVKSLGD